MIGGVSVAVCHHIHACLRGCRRILRHSCERGCRTTHFVISVFLSSFLRTQESRKKPQQALPYGMLTSFPPLQRGHADGASIVGSSRYTITDPKHFLSFYALQLSAVWRIRQLDSCFRRNDEGLSAAMEPKFWDFAENDAVFYIMRHPRREGYRRISRHSCVLL